MTKTILLAYTIFSISTAQVISAQGLFSNPELYDGELSVDLSEIPLNSTLSTHIESGTYDSIVITNTLPSNAEYKVSVLIKNLPVSQLLHSGSDSVALQQPEAGGGDHFVSCQELVKAGELMGFTPVWWTLLKRPILVKEVIHAKQKEIFD